MKKRGNLNFFSFNIKHYNLFSIVSFLAIIAFFSILLSGLKFNGNNNLPLIGLSIEETCGNEIIEGNEECDDGSSNSDNTPDACRTICRLPSCGDNVVDGGEACDDGNNINGDGCSNQCIIEDLCGNDILNIGEECDDGNKLDDDGCSSQCLIEDLCGNNIIDNNEVCDSDTKQCKINGYDGSQKCNTLCNGYNECKTNQFCGDNLVNGNEQCDANQRLCLINNYQGSQKCNILCSGWGTCFTDEYCGDGIKNGNEQCDDGNNINGDECSSLCINENSICGNKICELGEDASCKTDCDGIGICGNNILEGNEVCDMDSRGCVINNYQGIQECNSQCNGWSYCSRIEFCGDGVVNGNEQCDKEVKSCIIDGIKGLQECDDQCNSWEKCVLEQICNDGVCSGTETCSNCEIDCGECLDYESGSDTGELSSNQKEATPNEITNKEDLRQLSKDGQFTFEDLSFFINKNSLWLFVLLIASIFATLYYLSYKSRYS